MQVSTCTRLVCTTFLNIPRFWLVKYKNIKDLNENIKDIIKEIQRCFQEIKDQKAEYLQIGIQIPEKTR